MQACKGAGPAWKQATDSNQRCFFRLLTVMLCYSIRFGAGLI
jgi:hypothetical protein